MGCAVADEFFKFLIRKRGVPTLEVRYEGGEKLDEMVAAIMDFLKRLREGEQEQQGAT
jgi:hypothetical protein